jgi:CHASE2 domain-containing sensor protein
MAKGMRTTRYVPKIFERGLAPFRKLHWRFWVTFLLACVLAEGGEFLFERLTKSEGGPPQLTESLVTASGFYQRIVTARRNPIDRFTAIVEIDPKRDYPSVSDSNVCAEREFLAHLLTRISNANPAVIVIDKFFGRDTCDGNSIGTQALLDAFATVSATHPIVVGVRTDALDLPVNGAIQTRIFVDPHLPWGPDTSQFRTGILNIANDNRRLPLQWQIYMNEEGARNGTPIVYDTLALAAAQLYDADLLRKSPRLARLIDNGNQPFIGFLNINQFRYSHLYAHEVCGNSIARGAGALSCESANPLPTNLRNRVVLIGENDRDRDAMSTIIGALPGFYVQANYIEALLDDRYYTPGGPILDYGFAFIFLLGLELILVVYHHDALKVAILTVGLILGTGALLYLTIMLASVYIDPLAVSGSAVLIKLLHFLYGFVKRDPLPASVRQG